TIGWTGTHSTLKYLDRLLPILKKLQKQYSFNFLVIADKDPKLDLENYSFQKWNKATEWKDLSGLDIGLMPLENTDWEEGKCGFKALQYMALGIPTIVSPTGANSKIISNGVNGFVCETNEEWKNKISTLLIDEEKRQTFSRKGRETVKNGFSKEAWESTYLSLFKEKVVNGRRP
ncbi:MAG: glycosyltransferase family 4 protein, partial [Opitutaceae bacterium]|nr:glycosyltransferase family 4 protein [Cytophagales bacterium]